jgi:hypothetical protein
MVEVEYLGETKTFSPQEISSMVLTKVRNNITSVYKICNLIHRVIDEGSC